jgi:hypothetical protein
MLEVRATSNMGRGVFAMEPIKKGTCLVVCQGWFARTDALAGDCLAMQVGPDLWLCSKGESLDDCINHSCEPNAGFITGEPALFALRDIAANEQITWDYSTSIAEPGWTLDCLCGSAHCRGVIRSWWELGDDERARLFGIALTYLREDV